MTVVETREVSYKRLEWSAPIPANHRDVYDALAMAAGDYLRRTGKQPHDDSICVYASDEEIIVWYEVKA